MEDIEGQGGFSRAGQSGDNHKLVLGDIQADILEIVQAGVADAEKALSLLRMMQSETDRIEGFEVIPADALKLVLNQLVCGGSSTLKINAGLMMLNDQGTVDSPSGISGCPLQLRASSA